MPLSARPVSVLRSAASCRPRNAAGRPRQAGCGRPLAGCGRLAAGRGLAAGGRAGLRTDRRAAEPAAAARRPDQVVNDQTEARTDFKELVVSILQSHATKRDARSYISRFGAPKPGKAFAEGLLRQSQKSSDEFRSHPTIEAPDPLRTAIIKIRDVDAIESAQLRQIGKTVTKLSRLGLQPIVVVDPRTDHETAAWKDAGPRRVSARAAKRLDAVGERVVRAIEGPPAAPVLQGDDDKPRRPRAKAHVVKSVFSLAGGRLAWALPELVLSPVTLGIVPVVVPTVYDEADACTRLVSPDELVCAMTEQLASAAHADLLAVEKVIYIDPLGGMPSAERNLGAHVYVNLEQESAEVEHELATLPASRFRHAAARDVHLANLAVFRRLLAVLPSSAAGLVTTPATAASPSTRNPLIYNLLTDKPVLSSSLPIDGMRTPEIETTLLRRGMPVTIFYSEDGMALARTAPAGDGALPPAVVNGKYSVVGTVESVALDRLVGLIEDSFGRALDVDDYLGRINGHIAGLVIAGDYEGAAIITWERPAGAPAAKIAYLDKFAVLRRSQGAAGVADIVFKAMVMQLFPDEIVWRSRIDNPVNKWYFDRSKGSLKLPGRQWTMFWTGANAKQEQKLGLYADICAKIAPSWKK
ncbi:uncharacterized protein V1510DRAFT_413571 [Dipodascopsis tothii]|uniref:uncharacterized protein n=1 Tax=Dipodascopsis tothii TaxID=44089 RepID=UPI0034CF2A4B